MQTRPIALDFVFCMFVFLIVDGGRRLPARTMVALGVAGVLFGTYLMMGDPWSKSDYRAYALGFPSAFLLAGMIALEAGGRHRRSLFRSATPEFDLPVPRPGARNRPDGEVRHCCRRCFPLQ